MNFPQPEFLWPEFLWLLAGLPLLVAAYLWLLGRKRKAAVRYASLALVREAMGRGGRWRRHLPALLLLLALATLIVASARPVAVLQLPSRQQTVMLAMDVSGSMRAGDVKPNRLAAAQEAAKAFIAGLPRHVRVGIVAFAGSAQVAQLPTQNREDLVKAVDSFQLQRGTATGNGLVLSLATLFPDSGFDLAALGTAGGVPGLRGRPIDRLPAPGDAAPVAPGSYRSAAIIMLTDGQRTTGVDPVEAARLAAARGVRVYTVGIGTAEGETIGFEGWSMRVRLDDETLKTIAGLTQAEYFYAGNADDLRRVYESLGSRLAVEKRETEITALLALLGALFTLVSAGLSVLWFNRVL